MSARSLAAGSPLAGFVLAGLLLLALSAGCARRGADAGGPLPKLGAVTFALTDHDAQPFGADRLTGKVWAAAFMFTRCPTVCPVMTARMAHVQKLARERDVPLSLLSFSVDPAHDTPEVLRAFARERGLDTSDWVFLTGDSAAVRETAERGFKIGVEGSADPSAEHYGITHGTHLVLLDRQRTIRGYYQSTDDERVEALLSDAARLAAEPR
jgi:protein SCO1/2